MKKAFLILVCLGLCSVGVGGKKESDINARRQLAKIAKNCLKPPLSLYGAVLMECTENPEETGEACCIYATLLKDENTGGDRICKYLLCRNNCKTDFFLYFGVCKNEEQINKERGL